MRSSGLFDSKIIQLIIAILIPNIGGWISFGILANMIAKNESNGQVEPDYAPPDYVSISID